MVFIVWELCSCWHYSSPSGFLFSFYTSSKQIDLNLRSLMYTWFRGLMGRLLSFPGALEISHITIWLVCFCSDEQNHIVICFVFWFRACWLSLVITLFIRNEIMSWQLVGACFYLKVCVILFISQNHEQLINPVYHFLYFR